MRASPLFRDTLALCGVLLQELAESPAYGALRQRLEAGALRLLDHVTLALGGFDRLEQVVAADAELRMLRTHLLLALELAALPEESFLSLSEQADTVGRQLGGWRKKLNRVEEPD